MDIFNELEITPPANLPADEAGLSPEEKYLLII